MDLPSVLPDIAAKSPQSAKLLEKAKELEAAFVGEMLGHAHLGDSPSDFGGGVGEDQFASFLRNEQARLIVEKGGVGLAETIFKALLKSEEARHEA